MLVPARARGSRQVRRDAQKSGLKPVFFARMSPFVDALKFSVSGKPAFRLSYNAAGGAAVLRELEVDVVVSAAGLLNGNEPAAAGSGAVQVSWAVS